MRVFRIAGAFALALGLMGCASGGYPGGYDDGARMPERVARLPAQPPAMAGTSRVDSFPGQKPLQCVPYARDNSAIKIYGDAWTWWDQAANKYERGALPASGTVIVLHNYAGPNHGHVAVVRRIVSSREIRIDHANWTNDGSIYLNNPVQDVSPNNDWSQVKVFNIKTGGWGGKIYPVKGFIGAGSNNAPEAPRILPPMENNAPDDFEEELPPVDDALLAQAKQPAPPARVMAVASAPLAPARRAGMVPVAAAPDEINPPAGSPYALTAEDLAIP